jgi:predicted DCC family thiol-disulfide oxidoreductase YuxK
MSDQPIFLFDGVCVFCSRSVRFVVRFEREARIRFVAIQSAEGRALAAEHGVDADDPDTFLFIDEGTPYPKSDGVIALFRHLSRPWRWLSVLGAVPRPIRDWMYGRVARNRYRIFGRTERCMMPTAALRARFVLPES